MAKDLVVKFRGVRGSFPSTGKEFSQYGGNTTCLEIWAGSNLIIIDAGTGIISLGYDLLARLRQPENPFSPHKKISATLLFTHYHHDHLQGFPFFVPAYLGSSTLFIFGPRSGEDGVETILHQVMNSPFFPVALRDMTSAKVMQTIEETDAIFLKEDMLPQVRNIYHQEMPEDPEMVKIKSYRSLAHPNIGTLIFRIEYMGKSLVFATDTEGYTGGDQRLIKHARQTDLLIHDAQYDHEQYLQPPTKQGYGHSTLEMAVEVAQKAQVKKLAIFHHDPTYDDTEVARLEAKAQQLFPGCFAAKDGLEIIL
jgi:phosphoribosyl 1,2-cyclic phosphodiesterase